MPNALLKPRYLFSEIPLDNYFVTGSLLVQFLLQSVTTQKKHCCSSKKSYEPRDVDRQIRTHSVYLTAANSVLMCNENVLV